MSKRIYCGKGKKQNDTWFKATISAKEFRENIEEFNGYEFVKVDINVKDTPDQYGKDVFVTVDTWKPDNQPIEGINSNDKDDLPF